MAPAESRVGGSVRSSMGVRLWLVFERTKWLGGLLGIPGAWQHAQTRALLIVAAAVRCTAVAGSRTRQGAVLGVRRLASRGEVMCSSPRRHKETR